MTLTIFFAPTFDSIMLFKKTFDSIIVYHDGRDSVEVAAPRQCRTQQTVRGLACCRPREIIYFIKTTTKLMHRKL
jgi:hypothetical protein